MTKSHQGLVIHKASEHLEKKVKNKAFSFKTENSDKIAESESCNC